MANANIVRVEGMNWSKSACADMDAKTFMGIYGVDPAIYPDMPADRKKATLELVFKQVGKVAVPVTQVAKAPEKPVQPE